MILSGQRLDFEFIRKQLETLPNALASFSEQISAVLLFGSLATGKETPLSDVDLAMLYKRDLKGDQLTKVHSQVYEIISDLLRTDDIDLINLNTAPLSMQYGAVQAAKILMLNDRAAYIDFYERTVKFYLDFKPLLDECNQTLLETLARRTING